MVVQPSHLGGAGYPIKPRLLKIQSFVSEYHSKWVQYVKLLKFRYVTSQICQQNEELTVVVSPAIRPLSLQPKP